uniref:C2 domain-containing protein n=1 Tax=Daphnia galeata TaxID=27404 RepID=A0A8J2WGU4_9CRUS|nr:unnamed protein product [Daphnia galeata]
MESSTYVCEPNQVTIHCFVSWLLFPNRLEVADASGSSSFLDFKVSNLFLAAFIAVCGFSVFIMFTAMMCCLFCWWKRNKFNNRKKMKNNFIVKQRSSRTNLNTPVIRSEDIISFVLPAQKNHALGEPHQSNALTESNPLKATPILGSVGNYRGNHNSLNPSNLNLKHYSPGQETNENINNCRAKIGFSIQMDSSRRLLILKILGALNLPARSKNIAPDPYVKIIILPERQIKCVTKTVKSNRNPFVQSNFLNWDMSGLNLNETEILLVVRDRPESSRYERCVSRSITLGQAIFCVAEFDEVNYHRRQVRWCLLEIPSTISPCTDIMVITNPRCSKGEMLISLLYQVDHGRMILELLQIRPMPVLNLNTQDKEKVTIKVLLYERGYLISSRRTNSIRRDEATALIREKFVFALHPHVLHEASCQLVLVTKSPIGTLEPREHWDGLLWGTVTFFLHGQIVQALPPGLTTGMTWHTDPEFLSNAGIRYYNYKIRKSNVLSVIVLSVHV